MKLTEPILDYEGKPLEENDEIITYRYIFATALNTYLSDESPSIEEKVKAFQLSNRLYSSEEVELDVSESALILERVGKLFTPLIYGRAHEFVNNKGK